MLPLAPLSQLGTLVRRDSDVALFQLELKLDIVRLRKDVAETLAQHSLIEKDGRKGYLGLGLMYSDQERPFTDALDTVVDERYEVDAVYAGGAPGEPSWQKQNRTWKIFPHWNEAGHALKWLETELAPIRLLRGRLLQASPGYRGGVFHVDRGEWRLHIPIYSDPLASIEFANAKVHLPADGSVYLLNGNIPHRVRHDGSAPRLHLVFTIYPETVAARSRALLDLKLMPMDGAPLSVLGKREEFAAAVHRESGGRCELCGETPSSKLEIIPRTHHLDWTAVVQKPALGFFSACSDCLANICESHGRGPHELRQRFDELLHRA